MLHKIFKHIHVWELVLFCFILLLFVSNTFYLSYPDEFVNLLAGKSILTGQIPYKDFFDHHLPFAWYLSSFLLLFSFKSYVIFRILWAVLLWSGFTFLALWMRNNCKNIYPYYLIFYCLYPILSLYFWFHLFLADSLAIFFFSIIFWLLLVGNFVQKNNIKIIFFTSILTFCFIFSSLTYIYLAMILYIWQIYLLCKAGYKKKILLFFFVSVCPYLLYFLYLFASGSLKEFYIANFYYNTKLYISIPNYTYGHFFNPLKFALTLISNFYSHYLPLISTIKNLDIYSPMAQMSALGILSLFIIFLVRNKYLAFLFFLIVSFSAPRSDISHINEADYQVGLFIILGLISTLMSLHFSKDWKLKEILFEDVKRVTQFLLFIFLLFSGIFLTVHNYNNFFQRYTQKMPSISDRSDASQFIDNILQKGDYYWIGPYDPDIIFFVNNQKLPGKFISLLPQFKEDEIFRNSFISQFEQHPPKIIIYKHESSIFMTPSLKFGDFFIEWMNNKYTPLDHIPNIRIQGSPTNFRLNEDLYIRNDVQKEMLQKIRTTGYVE